MAAAKSKSKAANAGSPQAEPPAKKPTPKKTPRPPREVDPAMPWRRWLRVLLSLAILYHLSAVFAAPWALQTEPAYPPNPPQVDAAGRELPPTESDLQIPPLTAALHKFFQPYLNATYLNHGYDFFSPNPSGSFLIRYEAQDADGNVIASEVYPDLEAQWPRLFYHRHMMLAAQGAPEFGDDWARLYGAQLMKKYDAEQIRFSVAYHRLLTPQQVKAGTLLDNSNTYEDKVESLVITKRDLEQSSSPDNFRPIAPVRRDAPVKIPGVGP